MQRILSGLVAAVLLVGLGAFVMVPNSQAFVIWCWDDPAISVNGVHLDLGAAVGSELGPADVQKNVQVANFFVHVAPGTRVNPLGKTQHNFAETVQVRYDGAPGTVRIDVQFQAQENLPAALAIKKNGVQVTQGTNGSPGGVPAYMGTTAGGVSGPTLSLN